MLRLLRKLSAHGVLLERCTLCCLSSLSSSSIYLSVGKMTKQVTWQHLKSAMEILRRFNLILVLDFVDDEMWALEEALGWTQARKQARPLSYMCIGAASACCV